MTRTGRTQKGVPAAVLGLAVLGVAGHLGEAQPLAAGVLLLATTADDGPGLRSQVLWILGAAVVGGALGYGIATVAAPAATTIALGFGIAVGGGLGAVVRLLAVGDTEPAGTDTVTVSSGSGDTGRPDPQPVDLFDENPDPILYVDDSGDGPVVRAANAAFEETFGVGSEAVGNAALADAVMLTDRTDDIVAAAREATSFDAVVDCETPTGERPFRVRTAAVARGSATRGYVLYTPVEKEQSS